MSSAGQDPLDQWLGRPITDAPVALHHAVFEYAVGVGLEEATTYAVQKARYVLSDFDPDMRDGFEDVAQDVIVALAEKLPSEPIRHWRAWLSQRVRWRVRDLREERLAAKRHPGRRVGFDTAVACLEDTVAEYDQDRLFLRADLVCALDSVPDPPTRAVLKATFVIPTHDAGYDVRTTAEVAALLGMSRPKVKRLRAQGVPILRKLLDPGSGQNAKGIES
ncbi:sigma-70 family RNA polymerase sigma factor [Nocardia uniformis]|uniref:Sigma-70 family RNA polymerase sigma factor n=1 Tax=Nocardia uniformis TaxID=53432 RepID=A0A849C285_9NOCA|nr:sigma-70 family RNA polymerase sigma factor [Nocardia uniformis]NNH70435.1 sigma-70 family RNA polymerase sigma factor [Nocardia uniformis]